MNILSIPKKLYRISYNLLDFLYHYEYENRKRNQFEDFSQLQMEAAHIQHNTFKKYHNCNRGKNVAVIGSGPTLDKWRAHKDCVQIGVNGTFIADNVNLDFWFIQDYNENLLSKMTNNINNNCKKFFGMHYMLPGVKPIPFFEIEKNDGEQYFFYDNPIAPFPYKFTFDISSKPFITYGSTIFVALQFALYTHPDKIYIVGCDCSKGHFSAHSSQIHNNDLYGIDNITEGWRQFAVFAKALYPDIEIISVNPIGLKGLFRDEYTD